MKTLTTLAVGMLIGSLTTVFDSGQALSNYYSFNVFENRGGRWVYSAAFLP